METNKPKTSLVKIGRHLIPRLAPTDYIILGERRWHSLHSRAQEMLEDSRADSAQRVEIMKALYKQRDETLSLAVYFAATIEGALEVIQHAEKKNKLNFAEDIDAMSPEEIIQAAMALFNCDYEITSPVSPKT
jgi:hypothetical protein